jgi:hypothetical protein
LAVGTLAPVIVAANVVPVLILAVASLKPKDVTELVKAPEEGIVLTFELDQLKVTVGLFVLVRHILAS